MYSTRCQWITQFYLPGIQFVSTVASSQNWELHQQGIVTLVQYCSAKLASGKEGNSAMSKKHFCVVCISYKHLNTSPTLAHCVKYEYLFLCSSNSKHGSCILTLHCIYNMKHCFYKVQIGGTNRKSKVYVLGSHKDL